MEFFLSDPKMVLAVGFLLGGIVGSFINVCAYRIPLEKSIITPRSFCPSCEESIPWSQNLPLFSWLSQRGMAKCCAFKIPIRYFWVELFTGVLFGWLFFLGSSSSDWSLTISGCLFGFILINVVIIDSETMTIPDRFTIGGALLGLFLSYLYPSIQFVDGVASSSRFEAFGHSLGGMLIGSSILYWIGVMAHGIFGREALGEGDVKLLGCIGAFCGWKGAIFAIFGGAMIGSFLLLPIIIFSRLGWKKTKDEKVGWGKEVPFGPFLAIAALLFWLGARHWMEVWFFGKLSPVANFLGV